MSKIIAKIATVFILISFANGCGRTATTEETTQETTTTIETTTTEEFKECTEEEYAKARQDIETAIEAISTQDGDALKALIAEEVKLNVPNLDAKIQLTFEMLGGEITSCNETEVICRERLVYFEERCTLMFTYDVYVEDKKFYMEIYYVPRTDTKYNNIGVYLISIMDYEKETIYYELSRPSLVTVGGVFSSDQYTMDYNAEQLAPFYREVGYYDDMVLWDAVELNRIGIEKIEAVELVEKDDSGGMDYIIKDSVGDVYYILANENGDVEFVHANDRYGNTVLLPDY